ncbi:unnamed protein product [Cunninghamella blakesleeana]
MTQQYHDKIFMNPTNSSPFYISPESSKMTLWMGDLEPWMDEHFLKQLWTSMGENVIVKLIRDKRTGNSLGYAFIGFSSAMAAQRALATIHGTKMPNSQRAFRLNWASGGGILDKKEDRAPEYSLFVGDLSSDVDETYLLAVFRQRYPSCHSAKVMTDPISGASRGYGFVRFHDQQEQQDALVKMNGVYCGHRPVRISLATPKSTSHARYYQLALQAPALIQQPTDPSNTTVFVGGLSTPVSEEELRLYFSPFGEVTYVKIPPGKGCGFVQYVSRASAELAIEKMNGFQIGQSRIRLSWGRSQNDKQQLPLHLHPSTSTSSDQNNNIQVNMSMANDHSTSSFLYSSNSAPTSSSSSPPLHLHQQSMMSLGDTYYMNQQWQNNNNQNNNSQNNSNQNNNNILQQQQQQSFKQLPLPHSFQHLDNLHHLHNNINNNNNNPITTNTTSTSSAPLFIDTNSSTFLRNSNSNTTYDPNIMLSPVSSTGNPTTKNNHPYPMVINNTNNNQNNNITSSPGLHSLQSLSPPSSGRFPIRFSQHEESKIMEHDKTYTTIPSTTLSPPIHFVNRQDWMSPSSSSSISNNNNNNNSNMNNNDHIPNINPNPNDYDSTNGHWGRIGGIYA